MKKIFLIIIVIGAGYQLWNRKSEEVPPTSAIDASYRCVSMQGYRGDPNWSTAQGDGWHTGQILKQVGTMFYSIPYRAHIADFRFERTGQLKASGGPSSNGIYYAVKIYRRIEREYMPGDADPATLEQILPKREVFERTVYFYEYLNGTWRVTEKI